MRYWTAYWRGSTVAQVPMGGPCDHTAGNSFAKRGVRRGHRVFVLSFFDGELHVIGAMTVEDILKQRAAERLLRERLWPAKDHLVALSRRNHTLMRDDAVVPRRQLSKIKFIRPTGNKRDSVKFRNDGRVEPQVFRTEAREITPETAALFERVLAAP